jgi:hypothetical protein
MDAVLALLLVGHTFHLHELEAVIFVSLSGAVSSGLSSAYSVIPFSSQMRHGFFGLNSAE